MNHISVSQNTLINPISVSQTLINYISVFQILIIKESGWALYIVIFYQLVFLMAFFYFIYTLTLSDMSRTYLSLDGNSSSRACKLVPLIITNLVEGDINGYWATANSFHQNGSIFALSFSGTQITDEIYTSIMSRFRDQLKSLSSRSALRDAAWNAMAWATFGFQGRETNYSCTPILF